jgi:hypothetical protein
VTAHTEVRWHARELVFAEDAEGDINGRAIALVGDSVVVAGPIEEGGSAGGGPLALPDEHRAFVGRYSFADGTYIDAATWSSVADRGIVGPALELPGGRVAFYDADGLSVLDGESLSLLSRWELPEVDLPVFIERAVVDGARVLLAGRKGNVLGRIDPILVCVQIP